MFDPTKINSYITYVVKSKIGEYKMFLRFSKGPRTQHNVSISSKFDVYYLKAVFLGDSLIMEYGDEIVGIAKLYNENNRYMDYDVIVAGKCVLSADAIARRIKDMIVKCNKFSFTPNTKRRLYHVEVVDSATLPIKAEIKFTKKC